MYTQSRSGPGLGFAPAVAIAIGGRLFKIAGSLFQSKDKARIARIEQAFALAMSGDDRPQPNLNDLSGEAYLTLIATNRQESGSAVAQAVARARLAEFKGRSAATGVIGGLLPISTIPTTIAGTAQRALSNPLVLGGVVLVGVYFLTRKRGR